LPERLPSSRTMPKTLMLERSEGEARRQKLAFCCQI
jgi:hypothetical protein